MPALGLLRLALRAAFTVKAALGRLRLDRIRWILASLVMLVRGPQRSQPQSIRVFRVMLVHGLQMFKHQ